jgi:undecaprenyl-diphosphatase
MTFLESVLLGIVQGLTEFLPISSTAHLTLIGKLLGLIHPDRPEQWTAFIAVIQLGTALAVVIYFVRDLASMVRDILTDLRQRHFSPATWHEHTRLAMQIALGTVPVVVIGLTFKEIIEGNLTKEITTIATSLIVLAVLLYIAERVGTRQRERTTWRDSVAVGFAQSLALIPGASRSGTTITAGLFMGLTRETAARFSFLLSIPAVLASGGYEFYQMRHYFAEVPFGPVIVATLVSGLTGYAAIAFLLKYLRTHSTLVFIQYRIVLGVLLLTLHVLRVI